MSQSLKQLNKTERAKAIKKLLKEGKDLPTIKANIQKEIAILEHEDDLIHFDFIHHNFDQATGKDRGVWNKNQKCYPQEWPSIKASLNGKATEVILVHDPNKAEVTGEKKTTLTGKQLSQKDYTDAFGVEPDESLTIAQLKEAVDTLKEIDEAYGLLSPDTVIERPTSLEKARLALESKQSEE